MRLLAPISDLDRYWLAGVMEGEGSFMAGPPSKPNRPVVQVQMTDEDVIARIASLFGLSYCSVKVREGYKPTWIAVARGLRAVELMELLRPLMGVRRTAAIDKAIASYRPHESRKLTPEQAGSIRHLLADGTKPAAIMERYGISRSMVQSIKANDVWPGRGPDLSATIQVRDYSKSGRTTRNSLHPRKPRGSHYAKIRS